MDTRKLITKRDMLIILGALALAALLWLFAGRNPAPTCVVSYNGVAVKALPLDEDAVFTVSEAPGMRFEIRDGRAAVTHSDCPDQVCVRAGYIARAGQAAVCLPNKIVLSIEGAATDPTAPDMIAG